MSHRAILRHVPFFGMTLRIDPGFGQVIHSMTLAADPEPMAVTYGVAFDVGSADSPALMAAAAVELHDSFGDTVIGAMGNVYTLTTTEIRYVPDSGTLGDDPTIAVTSLARVGAQPGGVLPQNCAVLIHKRTARSGRRGRGRMYVPGIPEGDVSQVGGITTLAGWQTALTAFYNRIVAAPDVLGPVLLHSTSPTVPLLTDPLLVPDGITAFQVDGVIATQRRRLRH